MFFCTNRTILSIHYQPGREKIILVKKQDCTRTREEEIAHLRQAGVSYVFAGKDSLDLPLAMRKLKEQFGIENMRLSGGGIVDWAFLQAGLIDEISLVVPPVIDGRTGLASAFDDSPFAVRHSPVPMRLVDVNRLDGNGLRLRYSIEESNTDIGNV